MSSLMLHGRHVPVLVVLQVALIIIFGFFVEYGSDSDSAKAFNQTNTYKTNQLGHYYPMFQDVHVMMFIGFGFLMTFLKKYGYSAVSLNFLIAAIVLQWATLCQGFYHHWDGHKVHIDVTSMLNADFASASVLISFGAVLGVTTPLQLIVMAVCEIAIFATNEWLGLDKLAVSDVGASMLVHVFGAYFGLTVSLVLRRDVSSEKEGASYTSDIFAMIGTIFLWLFWPSFNSGLAEGDAQHRAVMNTYYSLAACCVTAFAVSSLVSKEHKFDMVHIQNSTLAGGVAIGTAADMMIHPWGALIVGMIAGTLSVLGYRFLTPAMNAKLGIHDTCGVHNLHGMPGVLAAIVGAVTASFATLDIYGLSLYRQFPAMLPPAGEEFEAIKAQLESAGMDDIEPGLGRTAGTQAGYQIAALGMTLAVAIAGGVVTGFIMKMPFLVGAPVSREHLFDDELAWEVPEPDEVHHNSGSAEPMFQQRKTVDDSPL